MHVLDYLYLFGLSVCLSLYVSGPPTAQPNRVSAACRCGFGVLARLNIKLGALPAILHFSIVLLIGAVLRDLSFNWVVRLGVSFVPNGRVCHVCCTNRRTEGLSTPTFSARICRSNYIRMVMVMAGVAKLSRFSATIASPLAMVCLTCLATTAALQPFLPALAVVRRCSKTDYPVVTSC